MTQLSLFDLSPELLARVAERLHTIAADPVAILVTGSYAAGRATPGSDFDLASLHLADPDAGHHTWFEERPGRPLHVSATIASIERWLSRLADPADWSLGFPTDPPARYLHSTPAAIDLLGDPPSTARPAGTPELEDFLEAAGKTRRALDAGDETGARWSAHAMALLAPSLLIPLNEERRVIDRRDALEAALSLAIAPPEYREDLSACLGLCAVDGETFARAARRLPVQMLAFLRERNPDVDRQPWLSFYLANGTLERHLLA